MYSYISTQVYDAFTFVPQLFAVCIVIGFISAMLSIVGK